VQSAVSSDEAELTAPVALAGSGADFNRPPHEASQIEELLARADRVAPPAQVGTGQPIIGSSSINFAAIEQGIDEVFERIERLGDELAGQAGATRVAEWLVMAGGACAAFEYARIRLREGGPWQAVGSGPVAYEPRLGRRFRGRRWFGGRSAR
jgi:hypothetical protein